jgi:uncharacterized protein YoxC
MLNLTQTLLVVVITVLTVLLTIIGIQLIYILKEFRTTLHRVNQVLDQADYAITRITAPAQTLLHLVDGLKQGAKLMELVVKNIPEKSAHQ